MWEWVKVTAAIISLLQQSSNSPEKEAFRKHCWKRKNAGYQHFLFFHQVFYPFQNKYQFSKHIHFVSASASNLYQCEVLSFGKCLIDREKKDNNLTSRGFILLNKPFPKGQILDSTKLKEFAYVNFKCNENGRKFSKRRENTAKKRNCSMSNFSFSHNVLKKLILQTRMFCILSETVNHCSCTCNMSSANCFNLEEMKIL